LGLILKEFFSHFKPGFGPGWFLSVYCLKILLMV
jgi:hypothetical protein